MSLNFHTICPQLLNVLLIAANHIPFPGTHCELGVYLSNSRRLIVIKKPEELFVESEEMEIYSQTGPTFPKFDRRHHRNIVNGHRFLTPIFLPIPITHIVQFES
jgi:hypothetical protein